MNKIERVTLALRGGEVDRPPFSFWYHFGLQHMPGRKHAEAEIDFYRVYDLDFLKVMNDYPYPLPGGLDALASEEDWNNVELIGGSDERWREQLEALSMINQAIGREAMFIETIFSPWTTARRLTPTGSLDEARALHPRALLAAMEPIAGSLAAYAVEAVARGASGIFLSLGAATDDVMTADEYERWGRPFDLKVLNAVREAPFNVLHVHGKRIHFDSLVDYPVAAMNWSHFATAPSLAEGRVRSGKTVLGGIDEAAAAHLSPKRIEAQVAHALGEVGRRGLIVTPGCSVPTDTPVACLRAIKSAVMGAAKQTK
ncbi:MAG TPA: uroporphyrinogen decarboxylase family protein [Blastocatellia bacterium]|nr:uroporphyrinogen decarboxylase family protein [Blastocatellia bacterium]